MDAAYQKDHCSGCKAEMHYVAIRNDIIFALEPHFAGLARTGLTAVHDVVVVGDRFRPDEAPFEIGVDHASSLRCLGTLGDGRSEEHTSELQSLRHLVCRLLLEKK